MNPNMKQPIILAKPDRGGGGGDNNEIKTSIITSSKEQKSQSQMTESSSSMSSSFRSSGSFSSQSSSTAAITIITRDSDSRSVSPANQKIASVLRKESDGSISGTPPIYQIATKPSSNTAVANIEQASTINSLQLPNEMINCIKLVDDTFQICENAVEYLADQNDYLIVGVLGPQGSGKSYIMSALAGREGIFPSNYQERYESGMNCTSGIDMFVTGSRMILLDTQPLLTQSLMDLFNTPTDKKLSGEVAQSTTENTAELQSLQMAAFLISICNVVIVVDTWFLDTNIIRCLLDAEMLKPVTTTTASDDQVVEYFPHFLFIKNQASPTDFTLSSIKDMQDTLSHIFGESRLYTSSGLSISSGKSLQHLNIDNTRRFNLFLIPENDDDSDKEVFRGHGGFQELITNLRHQILSAHHQQLTTSPMSEKHWFHYASKTLDNIRKSPHFMEFSRFLP